MDQGDTLRGPFPSTRPSLIAHVAGPAGPEHRAAWEAFFGGYWPPLYAYLRRSGSSREEAMDLLQDFFIAGVEGKVLPRFDPSRGRFRTFLLVCLSNARRNVHRHERARPDRVALRIDASREGDALLAAPTTGSGEDAFEEEWKRQIGARARAALEARFRATGEEVSSRLLRDWVFSAARPTGADLARELGISPGDLYMRATRLRRAFAAEVESEILAWSSEPGREREEVLSLLLAPEE